MLPLTISQILERDLPNTPIYEKFQIFSGISVGSILAAANALEISTSRTREFFFNCSSRVFRSSVGRSVYTLGGALHSKYRIKWLIEELHKLYDGALLQDAKYPLLVGSVDQRTKRFIVFKSWISWASSLPMAKVVASSCAAQIYFDPVVLEIDGRTYSLSDGGNSGNNLSDGLNAEITRLYGAESDRIIVDLSCGEVESSNYVARGGVLSWLVKGQLIGLMLDCPSDKVTYELRQLLGDRYFAFNHQLTKRVPLDDARRSTLEFLQSEAHLCLSNNRDRYEALLSILRAEN